MQSIMLNFVRKIKIRQNFIFNLISNPVMLSREIDDDDSKQIIYIKMIERQTDRQMIDEQMIDIEGKQLSIKNTWIYGKKDIHEQKGQIQKRWVAECRDIEDRQIYLESMV